MLLSVWVHGNLICFIGICFKSVVLSGPALQVTKLRSCQKASPEVRADNLAVKTEN